MKAIFDTSTLAAALGRVQGITARSTNLTATSAVRLQATDDGRVEITATDLESGFKGTYQADVQAAGVIVIDSAKLFEIVRNYPHKGLSVHEVETRWIEIGGQGIEYHLVSHDPDGFPDLPTFSADASLDVDAGMLRAALKRALVVRGQSDDRRAHIAGALMEILPDEQRLRVVSTDGSRMAIADVPLVGYIGGGHSMIVPKPGLMDLLKSLPAEGQVNVAWNGSHVSFGNANEAMSIRLLEGEFPNYRGITDTVGTAFVAPRESFHGLLRRMSILSTEAYKGVIFGIAPEALTVSASNPEVGESREEMKIKYDGEAVEIAFNPRYFIDALGSLNGDDVSVAFVDRQRPAIVRDPDDKLFIAIIMPMKV